MDNGASSYRRYLAGDEDAFGEIVRMYFDNLVFFIDRYVREPAAAEDIAMDVFAYLVAFPRRYHFRVSLKTYLFMLGRSRALDYLRHRQKLPVVSLQEAENIPGDTVSGEDAVLTDQRSRAVNDALAQLEEQQRVAVHLVYFEELSCDEAARVMKKSRKQVYNLLYRAKKALRAILGEEGELLL